MNPFFESVLQAEGAYFPDVFLDEVRLHSVARDWAKEDFILPDWREEVAWPFDNADYIQFLGIATAIDFCYGLSGSPEKFKATWHGKEWSGSHALFACIMKAIEQGHPLLEAKYLTGISCKMMEKIFSGNGNMEIPLLKERWQIWRDVGWTLLEKYFGHFKNLFVATSFGCFDNGTGICERLVNDFPLAFKDERVFNNHVLRFNKKAMLLPLEYYGRASHSELLPQIKDAEKISTISDHQLPPALCKKRIIYYSPELRKKIESFEEISKGSSEEIQIRVATILTTTHLLAEINSERFSLGKPKINMAHLDYRLWMAGHKAKIPAHRTLTTDY